VDTRLPTINIYHEFEERDLRLDMLHLEHMKRQKRDERPLLSLAAPEPDAPAERPAEPESLGDPIALRKLN